MPSARGLPSSRARQLSTALLPIAVGIVGMTIALYPMLFSKLEHVQSDPGDTRLVNFLLEYEYRGCVAIPSHESSGALASSSRSETRWPTPMSSYRRCPSMHRGEVSALSQIPRVNFSCSPWVGSTSLPRICSCETAWVERSWVHPSGPFCSP